MGHEQALDAGAAQRYSSTRESRLQRIHFRTDSDSHGTPYSMGRTWYVGGPTRTERDTTNGAQLYEDIRELRILSMGSIVSQVDTPHLWQCTRVCAQFSYAPRLDLGGVHLAEFNQEAAAKHRGTTPFISAKGPRTESCGPSTGTAACRALKHLPTRPCTPTMQNQHEQRAIRQRCQLRSQPASHQIQLAHRRQRQG